jgi:tape measure domain-containing protein
MKLFTAWVEIEARKDKYRAGVRDLKRTTERDTREMGKIWERHGRSIQKVGLVIAGVGAGITASVGLLAKSFVSAAVDMEKMMKGLTAVAGSASEAATQLKELREVAKLPGLGLSEAVQASINLQAVRFSAEKAATFLKVMGNALATVGKGREDLAGVVRGMSQMQSRGKVLAEEINQISERIPQFRAAMLDAFGTATSEDIQKMGITVEEFLDRTVAELAKLPAVAGGTANAIENLRDAWFQLRVELGQHLLPAFTKIVDMLASAVQWFNDLSATQQKMIAWGTGIGLALGTIATALGGIIAVLPSVITGFTVLNAMSWGITGVGIAGVAAAITGLAIALDRYGRSKSNAFRELETIKNNAAGITAGIDDVTRAIGELQKHAEDGKTEVSLLGVGIKSMGADVLPIEEQIKRLTGRLQDLNLQLIINEEGLGKTYTEQQAQRARAYGWEVKNIDDTTKDVIKTYEELIGTFNKWTSITGEGYRSTIEDQIAYINELLTNVDKESTAWRGLNNLKRDLRAQDIAGSIETAREYLEIQKGMLDRRLRLIEENAEKARAALFGIDTQDESKFREKERKNRDADLKEAVSVEGTAAKKIIKIKTDTNTVVKKIADDGSLHMKALTNKEIARTTKRTNNIMA